MKLTYNRRLDGCEIEMAKNYSEQLGEWVKKKESTQRDKNLVAFLAVRDDVKMAVEAGYAVKTIWANMHELKRIEFSYDTFLNYVNRLIRRVQKNKSTSSTEGKLTDNICYKAPPPTVNVNIPTEKMLPEFTFNPVPNREVLI